MRVTNILLPEQHLTPDYAHPAHPPPQKHTHTHQQKGHGLLNAFAHPTSSLHKLFSSSHHEECTSFLITQLPKNKIKLNPQV